MTAPTWQAFRRNGGFLAGFDPEVLAGDRAAADVLLPPISRQPALVRHATARSVVWGGPMVDTEPMTTPSTFSQQLWDAAAPIYDAIGVHPFISGLADGTLPKACFGYFIVQDSHYLRDYSRALALTAARAHDDDEVAMFAGHAANAIAVERDLHAGLLGDLDLTSVDVDAAGSGPATTAYMSYLTAVCATGSYAEAVATVLPCYWIYREIGHLLAARSSPDPLYARWITTYGSPEFDTIVNQVLTAADRVGADLGAAERSRCVRHFTTTSRYEWMFWDAAYRRLEWPV
jgi:thiaminase/transcriptional activator TenA